MARRRPDPREPRQGGHHRPALRAAPAVALAMVLIVAGRPALASDGELLDPLVSVAQVPTPSLAYGAAISGDRAAIATHAAGLLLLDLADPADPQVRGTADTPGYARNGAWRGDLVLVADRAAGLRVIDAADPDAPVEVGAAPVPGLALSVATLGEARAVVPAKLAGLRVVDLDDPAAPALRGVLDTGGLASDVVVQGSLAYVADYGGGVVIADVADPDAPLLRSVLPIAGDANAVARAGDLLAVAATAGGLILADVSDPDAPQLVGQLDLPGLATEVTLLPDRGLALVACGSGGLVVADVSSPGSPQILRTHPTVGTAVGVARAGRHAVVACLGDGVEVVALFAPPVAAPEPSPAAGPLALAAAPNPFNPRTVLRYHVPRDGGVRLTVHDLAGRVVRTLVAGSRAAGTHRVAWDGRDRRGRPVAAGVYLARLQAGAGARTARLALVR